MNAQDIRNLSEAYMNVYDELDEAAKRSPKKVRGSKDTKSYQDGRSQAGMMVSGDSQVSGAGYMRRGGGIQTQTDPNERQPQQGRMDRYTRDEMEYRKARLKKEETDLYDIILSHLLDEGYAETPEAAEVIMVNMSEGWREDIVEATVLAAKDGVAGAVQVKQTKTPGFLGTGIGSKTVSTPIPGTFTRNTPGRVQSGPRPFDAYGSGSTGAKAEMGDRSGPTDAERSRYNAAVTRNNTVGDKSVEPSPKAVNQRAYQQGHSGLMPTRVNQNSTEYVKPNQSWRGY